jgi:hypothetical protein
LALDWAQRGAVLFFILFATDKLRQNPKSCRGRDTPSLKSTRSEASGSGQAGLANLEKVVGKREQSLFDRLEISGIRLERIRSPVDCPSAGEMEYVMTVVAEHWGRHR